MIESRYIDGDKMIAFSAPEPKNIGIERSIYESKKKVNGEALLLLCWPSDVRPDADEHECQKCTSQP